MWAEGGEGRGENEGCTIVLVYGIVFHDRTFLLVPFGKGQEKSAVAKKSLWRFFL